MSYVIAGYTIVLSILFLYGVQLVWRRRRLNRAVERVASPRRWTSRGRRPVTTAPPVDPPGRDRLPDPAGRRPAAAPTPAAPRRTGAPAPLRGGRRWCWWARWSSCWSKGWARPSTSTCRPTRPWPSGPRSGTKTFNLEGRGRAGLGPLTPSGVDFVVTSGATKRAGARTPAAPRSSSSPTSRSSPSATSAARRFVSDQILVKHSSNYIAAHPGRVTAPNGTKR